MEFLCSAGLWIRQVPHPSAPKMAKGPEMEPRRDLLPAQEPGGFNAKSPYAELEVEFFDLHARLNRLARILVLGCSDLDVLTALAARQSYYITAADQSDHRLDAARRLARGRALTIACVRMEHQRCSLPDESFDAVALLGDSLAQTNECNQVPALLAEAKRLLRPTGTLVLSVADGEWTRRYFPPDDIEMLPQGYIYRRSELSEDGEMLITHEFIASGDLGAGVERVSAKKLLGARQVLEMLNRAGFEATSFCKRAPRQSHVPSRTAALSPRLCFSCRTTWRQAGLRHLQLVS
jgi:SAM-dependent methyltransferase